MPRLGQFVLAGLFTFVTGLIIFFPAGLAFKWIAPPDTSLSSISGSIWRGSATAVGADGFYLDNLRWQFLPSELLRGRFGYKVNASLGSGVLESNLSVALSGDLTVRELDASLAIDAFQDLLQNPSVSGFLRIELESARFRAGDHISGIGRFEVDGLTDTQFFADSLGSFRGAIRPEDFGVLVSYESTTGLVDIEGRIEVLHEGRYRHFAKLRANRDTPPRLRDFIAFQPVDPERDGWHEVLLGEGQFAF